ncbi:hypothetical protein H072_1436 [Dactylellina haptotyla CBS 200.50]|uniref:DNA-directed RNA polymerase III subunit n=1 Tax=Dactylellina haptotyla (strain CBS 200.50) TaxID=1284197 RepID=S8CA59_DACHA|nr:hypothetical protein H072_1436 [Dactylellina haptotyla CBS 200.50]
MAFRGGRGGFRGGRGGSSNGGPLMPREFDVKPDFGPTEQFPDYTIPFQDPLASSERIHVARFRDHREKIHSGPLYTVLSKRKGLEDPFEDVVTYSSKKYHRQKRKVPKLDSRPYVFEFFPVELWETMDSSYAAGADRSVVINGKKEKKRLLISSLDTALPNGGLNGDQSDNSDDDDDEKEKEKKSVLAKLMSHKDEDDDGLSGGDAEAEEDDEREDEGEEEDDYQDDEEGDYNAEQYFDDGDGDVDYGDDDGGGGAWYD